MKRILALATAALTFGWAQAQAQQPLAFIACPMMRDTATVPCWLTQYKTDTYFLLPQEGAAGVDAPALGHQALIEGTPTGETRCGGKVLTNLHISIRPELDLSCDALAPATDAFQIADESKGAVASGAAAAPPATAAPAPAEPRKGSQRFEVLYDFDRETAGKDTGPIAEAAAYALANPKAEVHVTGFRAAVKLSTGPVLTEDDSIGLRRARDLVDTLGTLGLDTDKVIIVDKSTPELGDFTHRHAYIDIVFGGGDEPNSEH